ncbi:IS1595 family transposase [Lacihabitans sp. LS3-19]|nr:IS1595 family transposase [Lacihabitans sp. LS3-19]
MDNFDSLIDVISYFDTEIKALQYLEQKRWNGQPTCPHCSCSKVYRFSDQKRFKCASCREQFTAKVGTIFEDSKIPLRKWYVAIYLVKAHKKGISSHQLAKDIKVTQKSSWFMLHRIRFGLGENENLDNQLEGTVELDETFVGGKNRNRHADKKVAQSQGRSFKDKTPVMGMLQEEVSEFIERPSKNNPNRMVMEKIIHSPAIVRCRVVNNTKGVSLKPIIKEHVKEGSILVSDEWTAYQGLGSDYDHRIVDHRVKQYVNDNGDTTNSLEGFWTWLKRSYIGVYHSMSKRHLQNYVNEVAFRFNTHTMKDGDRLNYAMAFISGSIKYNRLIGK